MKKSYHITGLSVRLFLCMKYFKTSSVNAMPRTNLLASLRQRLFEFAKTKCTDVYFPEAAKKCFFLAPCFLARQCMFITLINVPSVDQDY